MSPKRAIIERVWAKAVSSPFALAELVRILNEECGYDMHIIPRENMAALIEDRFEGDWDEVAWSFGEFAYFLNAWVEGGDMIQRHWFAGCFGF